MPLLGLLAALGFGAGAVKAYNTNEPHLNPNRTVVVAGEIGPQTNPAVLQLGVLSRSRGTVTVLIDSYGGRVPDGLKLIAQVENNKAAGNSVECVILNDSASMASWLFLHCSKRYMVPMAKLLFHQARTGVVGVYTEDGLRSVADKLREIDAQLLADFIKATGWTEERARVLFKQEKFLSTEECVAGLKIATEFRPTKAFADFVARNGVYNQ